MNQLNVNEQIKVIKWMNQWSNECTYIMFYTKLKKWMNDWMNEQINEKCQTYHTNERKIDSFT